MMGSAQRMPYRSSRNEVQAAVAIFLRTDAMRPMACDTDRGWIQP